MCPETDEGDGSTSRPRLGSARSLVPVLVLAASVVLYSLLIVQQLLLGALVASWVVVLYVAWWFVTWFVRAYQRRTAAMESMADSLGRLAEREQTGPVFDDGERS